MDVIVPRTVTAVRWDGKPAIRSKLSDFRNARFYVLLGSPGLGKTTAFRTEAERLEDSLYLTARQVVRSNTRPRSEWQGKTLFIDGLDEVRAGRQDVRELLDCILDCLDRLGGPPSRLSCRSAAWLAKNDAEAIRDAGYDHPLILQLDPLTEEDVREILGHHLGKASYDFFEEAHDRGVQGLLDNPQSLEMLMKATANGHDWPQSRVETFNRACLELATEVNDEHRAAVCYEKVPENDPPASRSRVLDAASHITALYLLAGKHGIAWGHADVADPDKVLLINEVLGGDWTRPAWESALFVPQPPAPGFPHDLLAYVDGAEPPAPKKLTPGTQLPKHEHVAEYLAARHLTKVLEEGAILSRVLSLLTAGGGVPSPLRGVAAWLAALCPDARRPLIDLDPVGVMAYGDIGVFNEHERAHLLGQLVVHPGPSSDPWNFPDTALVGLASPRTIDDLREYMAGSDRSEHVQKAVSLILRGVAAAPLRCGGQLLGKNLLTTARDATWLPHVRHSALAAAIKLSADPEDLAMRLQLLQDVSTGEVDDPVGNLRAHLVRDLHPSRLAPKKVWDYVPIPVSPTIAYVLSQSSPMHCGQLLDALHARTTQPDHIWDDSLNSLVWDLLARAIEADDDSIRVARVYDWIELAVFDWGSRTWNSVQPDIEIHALLGVTDPVHVVQQWLANRPAFQQELLVEFLRRHEQQVDLALEAREYRQIVFGAGYPEDFHEWCIQQALTVSADLENAARWLITCAVEQSRHSVSSEEWLPAALRQVDDNPVLVAQLKGLAQHDLKIRRREMQYRTRRPNRKTALASEVLEHRDALLTGTGPLDLLVRLGQAYFDDFGDDAADGTERLRTALAKRVDATDVALNALVRVTASEGGPDIQEIMRLDSERRFAIWAMPFLAGLDILGCRGDDVLAVLGKGLERAVCCYLATPVGGQEMPAWFLDVLESRPDTVANVLVKLHRNRIQSKMDDSVLQKIVADEHCRGAVQLALPELLKAFPAKGYGVQLPLLREVLVAAIRYLPEEVTRRVRNRRGIRDMNEAQRVTWLGAGVAVAPDEFASVAVAFVEEGRDARTQHLVDVLHAVWKANPGRPLFDAATDTVAKAVASLVSALGRRRSPFWSGVGVGTAGLVVMDNASTLIEHMIGCLAKNPTRTAGCELDRLSNDSELNGWRNELTEAVERQQALHYRTAQEIPTVEEVKTVLRDGPPANAADLAALVVDRLERLAREIRDSSTDDWQHYWNEDKGKPEDRRPPWPKDENPCRDALLSALRPRLPDGVDARREASYAGNARADIRVCFSPHAIPIEIKKSSHRELWSAMRNQLIKKYARDPESAGHGIYVVLWFGSNGPEPAKTPPQGSRPKDARELARRLEEQLSDAEKHRINVVVIDVSRPVSRR